ncbi:MAG TPA: transketolase C-terminal domain-containing protein [Propionicimonas sp.]|jgi:transketolase
MSSNSYDPRKAFGAALTHEAELDERIIALSADSGGSSGLGAFQQRFPDRYLEFGIQEQGVTGVAAGLATTGMIPVFCAIAPFVTCRNFEQFRNDLGYMDQNVKVVGRNGGFTYADLGSTHHSLEDYALMRMIPGVTVLAPQDVGEIRGAVHAMLEIKGPVYMRIGNASVPQLFPDDDFAIGRGRHVREGADVTVISTGYTTVAVVEAVDALIGEGVGVDLLCLGTVAPLDEELIVESARRTTHVITVEEHYSRGGLGGAVAELLSGVFPVVVDRVAVPHVYVPAGPYAEILKSFGLDATGLEVRIRELVTRRRGVLVGSVR